MQSFICSFGHSLALGSSDEQDRQYLLSEEDSFTVQTNDEHITDVMSSIHGDILDALVTGTHEGIYCFGLRPWNHIVQTRRIWTGKHIYVYTPTHIQDMYTLNFKFPISIFMTIECWFQAWFSAAWNLNPRLPLINCVIGGKLFNFSQFHFHHWQNTDDYNSTYFLGLLWDLDKLLCVRCQSSVLALNSLESFS